MSLKSTGNGQGYCIIGQRHARCGKLTKHYNTISLSFFPHKKNNDDVLELFELISLYLREKKYKLGEGNLEGGSFYRLKHKEGKK